MEIIITILIIILMINLLVTLMLYTIYVKPLSISKDKKKRLRSKQELATKIKLNELSNLVERATDIHTRDGVGERLGKSPCLVSNLYHQRIKTKDRVDYYIRKLNTILMTNNKETIG